MERFHTVFFAAGLGCFALAFILCLIFPWMSLKKYHGMDYAGWDELTRAERITPEFHQLAERYPEAFAQSFGEVGPESYREALQLGRDLYIGQACWHCHSQFVRVVSNEEQRFGKPSNAQEYQNVLNQPHLWGTRRVGPDLTREGGKRPNDWHVAHFIQPKNVTPGSVMPSYHYWFEADGTPKKEGFAIISYIQWLGSDRVYRDTHPEEFDVD